MSYNSRQINDRWVPAIPIESPIDIKWCCDHNWIPHIYDSGAIAWNYFDCLNCGTQVESGNQPEDGPWIRRRWLAEHLFSWSKQNRKNRLTS